MLGSHYMRANDLTNIDSRITLVVAEKLANVNRIVFGLAHVMVDG